MITKMKSLVWLGLTLAALLAFGCGGAKVEVGKKVSTGGATGTGEGRVITEETREEFGDAGEIYRKAEAAGWPADQCADVVDEFEDLAEENNNMVEALYNIGVVQRNCGQRENAEKSFEKVVKLYPKNQLALTQLAVLALEDGDEAKGEEYLKKTVAVSMSSEEVAPAFVNAATLLRKRGRQGDPESFTKAQKNLRRALAVSQNYMPALYQLAMLYYDVANSKGKKNYLTLAQLVCSQAIKLDPEYAPTYHAVGMIALSRGELVDALQAFERAAQKDPKLFASLMNYAAINLNFRGYEEAKTAFEKAITLKSQSYDAHIGLGVALRGLGDFEGAKAEYKKAAEIDPKRTDYIFNVGVLEMDYLNTGEVEGYQKAEKVFQKFLNNALPRHKEDTDGKGPEKSWYEKAQDRIARCKKAVEQIKEAEREMAEMQKMMEEQKKREEELRAKAKELEAKEASGAAAPPEEAEGAAAGEE